MIGIDDGLERAFNPIMLKEMRASLRGNRFYLAHLSILVLYALGMLVAFFAAMPEGIIDGLRGGGDSTDPSRVGRGVFQITQFLNLGIVFLIVPGLAATALSGEHEGKTHDLLITTSMSAGRIVWGKFCAAMTQTITIFVSLLPLVGLCFLFGGLTVYQIVANYVFLLLLSALMVSFSLSISAATVSTPRAVISVYALAGILGAITLAFLENFERGRYLVALMDAYGFVTTENLYRRPLPLDFEERLLYVHAFPAALWIGLVALFFINAINRLKPALDNRSTALRLYYLCFLFGIGAALALSYQRHLLPTGSPDDRSYAMMGYAIAATTIALLGSLFACEDAPTPRLAAQSEAFRGWRRPLRLLWPGGASGAAMVMVSILLFLGASTAVFWRFSDGFDQGAWAGRSPRLPLLVAFAAVAAWAWFTTGLARLLATVFRGRTIVSRALLIFGCLLMTLAPALHWAIAQTIDRDPADTLRRHGPFSLLLSPILAVVSTLDLRPGRRDVPWFAGGLPIAYVFPLLMLAGGTLSRILVARLRRRLRI